MNLIEAWKAAKEGQRIKLPIYTDIHIYKTSTGRLSDVIYALPHQDILSDDWEIVREKRTKVTTVRAIINDMWILYGTPLDAKVTIEWED